MKVDLEAASDVRSLPFMTAGAGLTGGVLRDRPEDFRVDEIPAYTPTGVGEHLFIRFRKTNLNTADAVRRIARALNANPRDAGYAGLKDRHAITSQWMSVHGVDPVSIDQIDIEGIEVLEVGLHDNKLRTGHLRGNRFRLLIRGAPSSAQVGVAAQLDELNKRGVPNYYGAQRFGRGGGNLIAAAAWILDGGRPPRKPFERKLLVSTLQAAMFNELLKQRMEHEELDDAVEGDLMRKTESGGLFVSEDREVDAARVRAFEISATGPMFGAKMRWPERTALSREVATLERWGLTRDALRSFKRSGPGTRRPYRIRPIDASVAAEAEGLRLEFTLPKGAYATVLARELTR